jgi:hypothetical protein
MFLHIESIVWELDRQAQEAYGAPFDTILWIEYGQQARTLALVLERAELTAFFARMALREIHGFNVTSVGHCVWSRTGDERAERGGTEPIIHQACTSRIVTELTQLADLTAQTREALDAVSLIVAASAVSPMLTTEEERASILDEHGDLARIGLTATGRTQSATPNMQNMPMQLQVHGQEFNDRLRQAASSRLARMSEQAAMGSSIGGLGFSGGGVSVTPEENAAALRRALLAGVQGAQQRMRDYDVAFAPNVPRDRAVFLRNAVFKLLDPVLFLWGADRACPLCGQSSGLVCLERTGLIGTHVELGMMCHICELRLATEVQNRDVIVLVHNSLGEGTISVTKSDLSRIGPGTKTFLDAIEEWRQERNVKINGKNEPKRRRILMEEARDESPSRD